MAYVNMSGKPASKFILVQENNVLAFMQKVKENENLVACDMYINKDDGKIYFVERRTGAIMDCCITDTALSIDGNYINAEIPF